MGRKPAQNEGFGAILGGFRSFTSPACGRGRREAPGEGSLLLGSPDAEAALALSRKRERECTFRQEPAFALGSSADMACTGEVWRAPGPGCTWTALAVSGSPHSEQTITGSNIFPQVLC